MDCLRDDFKQGKLLGDRFVTVSPLNHGSFGMVFKARDTLTNEEVAIKCIAKSSADKDVLNCPAAIATDDQSEELTIHARLPSHPNIVNLVTDFETDHHQYMVLELCSNGDLYEAIRVGKGPLETEHVRAFMLELIDAIDHLHANGVFHRDIKPENIFLNSTGSMKLGDFGLATTETWSTEFAVGSDRYMAPEQFDASVYGFGYSPASADVWAIGVVLLNVLFQRNPFATPTQKDPLFADFVVDRQSLFDVFPNMSQDTYNVLVHSLALDPANRSLSAVREAVKAVVSFTTDDETLDDFCTEQDDDVNIATAAREPLRTPSVTSPTVNDGAFPWAQALAQTPRKPTRQLSTIQDEDFDMFPAPTAPDWHYLDADEASLTSAHDSGLGLSFKSGKSLKSSVSKPLVNFVGSLPISFARPTGKGSPYGASGSGFSKSWSDLYDEDLELEAEDEDEHQQQQYLSGHPSAIERVDTIKPSTPLVDGPADDENDCATPRPIPAVPAFVNVGRTASPLMRLIEEDKARPESPKQRSASIMDRWAALGNLRRAKADNPPPTISAPTVSPQKTNYADAFSTFSPFGRKPKSPVMKPRDRALSWRQGTSPTLTRFRAPSNARTGPRERKESPPANIHQHEAWSLDKNWREHKGLSQTATPLKHRKSEKSFLDTELADDIGDLEWVGGWHDHHHL